MAICHLFQLYVCAWCSLLSEALSWSLHDKQGSNIKFIQKHFASHVYWMNGFGVEQKPYLGWRLLDCSVRHNAYEIWHYHSSDTEDLSCLGYDTVSIGKQFLMLQVTVLPSFLVNRIQDKNQNVCS